MWMFPIYFRGKLPLVAETGELSNFNLVLAAAEIIDFVIMKCYFVPYNTYLKFLKTDL